MPATLPSMTVQDLFDGGANLNRGTRKGLSPILQELIAAPSRARYVDGSAEVPVSQQDGSPGLPFSTIQAAVDDLIANVNDYLPRSVIIRPGVYEESVVVDAHNIALVGADAKWQPTIYQPSGTALTVTNATRASLATYQASGLYSDLVNNLDVDIQNFFCFNIRFDGDGPLTDKSVELLGVKGDDTPTTTNFLRAQSVGPYGDHYRIGGYFVDNVMFRGLFMKNLGFCNFYDTEPCDLEIRNCTYPGIYYFENIYVRPCILDYESGHADGEPGAGHYGLFVGGYFRTSEDFRVMNEAVIGWPDIPYEVWVGRDLDLDDTCHVYLARATVHRDVLVEDGARFDFDNCYVRNNINIAAGAGACAMRGGRYIGSLTDPSGRLTRTVGN